MKLKEIILVDKESETPRFWGDPRAEGKGIPMNLEALHPGKRFSGKMIVPSLDCTQDFIGVNPESIKGYAESFENAGMVIDGIYIYKMPFESKGFKRQAPNRIHEYCSGATQ